MAVGDSPPPPRGFHKHLTYKTLRDRVCVFECHALLAALTGLFITTISLWPFVSPLLPRKQKHNCYCAQEVLSGLRQPVAVVHCGDGSQRLFVLEREGIVRILSHNLELIKEPFLDIHKLVQNGLKVRMKLTVVMEQNRSKNKRNLTTVCTYVNV